jgi:hypothetical protein
VCAGSMYLVKANRCKLCEHESSVGAGAYSFHPTSNESITQSFALMSSTVPIKPWPLFWRVFLCEGRVPLCPNLLHTRNVHEAGLFRTVASYQKLKVNFNQP